MNKPTGIIITTILVLALVSACAPPSSPKTIPGLAQTLAVRTLVATQGVSYFASPTPTPPPAASNPYITPIFVFDVYPSSTSIPSLTPIVSGLAVISDPGVCKNKAEFIQDVTCPDQTSMKGGQRFTKVWRLRNIGTCTWTKDYSLIFTAGDKVGGISPKPLGQVVKPGDFVEVGVDLIAPKDPNIYQGNWMLQDERGEIFGTGLGVRDVIWVSIIVGGSRFGNIFGGICGGGG